ncbi:hypothetical protein [Paenibacillus sabinae]|uniref:hypothetical protein n=1 Tax=Paenibacillus sabinae TaxID=365617 RepID=UPI00046C8FB0|nr:hypothetical protein [Paenibacillus sabinae]
MAKSREEMKRLLTPVVPYKKPDKPFTPRFVPTCGCGAVAEYEVYEHREAHCRRCMLDAVDSNAFTIVRRIGGYDDAS